MNRRLVRRIARVTGVLLLLLVFAAGLLFHQFTSPRTDLEIMEEFKEEGLDPLIRHERFKGHRVRLLQMNSGSRPQLPVLFFIHGSPGSMMDFKRYLKDPDLNAKANMMAYERVGYGEEERGEVLPSLQEELELIHYLIREVPVEKIIVVGYSYGGTIAMASTLDFQKKFSLAAAVRGDLEPMFRALYLYKWPWTRPLVPKVLRGAAEEKFRHLTELSEYDSVWAISPSPVVSIHGKKDKIVPYENSVYLERLFDKERYRLVSLEDVVHVLVRTDFEKSENELIQGLE